MLQQLAWFLHMICAFCIIILVLLQHGKGAEMGASLGSGASQTIFGSQGSGSFLTRITTIFALIFAVTSISLSFFINKDNKARKISELILEQQKTQQSYLPEENSVNPENLDNKNKGPRENPGDISEIPEE